MIWKIISEKSWKLYFLNFLAYLTSFSGLGQTTYPKAIIWESDTVICFTIPQSKELAKRNEFLKKTLADLQDCDSIVSLKTLAIENRNEKIESLESIIENKDIIISNHERTHALNLAKVGILNAEIKKQKRHKFIAIGVSLALIVAVIVK